jgi:hypothetical protein
LKSQKGLHEYKQLQGGWRNGVLPVREGAYGAIGETGPMLPFVFMRFEEVFRVTSDFGFSDSE